METINQLMEFFQVLTTLLPMGIIITVVAVLVIIFLIFSYFTGILVGSRKYRFYRKKDGELVVTVIYFLAGILPVKRDTYTGLKNTEIEYYSRTRVFSTDYDVTVDENPTNYARVYLYLHSGEKVLLKKLLVSPYPKKIEQIANNIQALIDDNGQQVRQDELLINNCRVQSFIGSLLAYLLILPWIYSAIISVAIMVITSSLYMINQLKTKVDEHQGIENTETEQDANEPVAVKVYTGSDLPSYIPKFKNSEITKINLNSDNNHWEVWQDVHGDDFNTMAELETHLKKAFQDKGWHCTQTRDFNHHNDEGNEIPNSGLIFYIRDYQQKIEGDVVIMKKDGGFGVVFSVPVRR